MLADFSRYSQLKELRTYICTNIWAKQGWVHSYRPETLEIWRIYLKVSAFHIRIFLPWHANLLENIVYNFLGWLKFSRVTVPQAYPAVVKFNLFSVTAFVYIILNKKWIIRRSYTHIWVATFKAGAWNPERLKPLSGGSTGFREFRGRARSVINTGGGMRRG